MSRAFSASIRSRSVKRSAGFRAGEAACVAIGVHRGHTVATDDGDALSVLEHLSPGHQYERIRKLLIWMADEGVISQHEANGVHDRGARRVHCRVERWARCVRVV
ncbi:hypothetical protein [Phytoactinopolyspora halophila]|uniref:hypothetical protein n=1 Tax=Phytoactinopolyspora halophila TaxID=1981511 RepID=UPI000F4E6B96|nr:hypothetical protein [Phytoactinopolyspora halophila]